MGNLTVKESGEMVNFISPNVSKITSFKVHFSPKQEGTGDPSPENVREITGWDGVTATRSGKNLIDKTAYENIYTTYDYIDSSYRCKKIQLKPNTTYTVSFTSTGADANVIILFNYTSHVNGNTFLDLRKASGSKTYTTDDTGCLYIGSVNTNNDKYNARMSVCEIQIEEGLTATDYEPYTGQTYPITFPTEAGTIYGGYVDLISGELVQTWYEFILDGVNNYLNSGSQLLNNGLATIYDYIGSGGLNNLPKGPVNTYTGAIICNKFPLAYNRENEGIATGSGSLYIRLLLDPSKLEDVSSTSAIRESMIKWQQENPLQIVYKLAEPITYQLTPQQILTLKGTNNVYSDANGQTEIKYWKH